MVKIHCHLILEYRKSTDERESVDPTIRRNLFRNGEQNERWATTVTITSHHKCFLELSLPDFLDRGKVQFGVLFDFYQLEDVKPTHIPGDDDLKILTKEGLGLKTIGISRIDDYSQVLEKNMMYVLYHLKLHLI